MIIIHTALKTTHGMPESLSDKLELNYPAEPGCIRNPLYPLHRIRRMCGNSA